MKAKSTTTVFYLPDRKSRFASLVFYIIYGVFMLYIAIKQALNGSESWGIIVFAISLYIFSVFFFYDAASASLALSDETVSLCKFFGRRELPWEDIEYIGGLYANRNGTVSHGIMLNNGKKISLEKFVEEWRQSPLENWVKANKPEYYKSGLHD